jgi:hypothetical protein
VEWNRVCNINMHTSHTKEKGKIVFTGILIYNIIYNIYNNTAKFTNLQSIFIVTSKKQWVCKLWDFSFSRP